MALLSGRAPWQSRARLPGYRAVWCCAAAVPPLPPYLGGGIESAGFLVAPSAPCRAESKETLTRCKVQLRRAVVASKGKSGTG